ncbi:MAG TPA: DnaD domain protein [Dehalococcoidia bacterium]|nr:DnaD domain protein [Dehalococcoidia bacterium]
MSPQRAAPEPRRPSAFIGFPARAEATAIPRVFFTDIMPLLADDPIALGVILHAIKVLQAKRGSPRWLTADELAADPSLAGYLASAPDAATAITSGLRRACDLRVLLPLAVEHDAHRSDLYFLNAPADRRGMEAVRSGAVEVGRVVHMPATLTERTSVFSLYESLIGTLSPLIADELAEAERLYPADWLEAAFREAAAQNARSWRYVTRILERWAIEGPDHAKTERDHAGEERYFRGKYGRILRQRLNS